MKRLLAWTAAATTLLACAGGGAQRAAPASPATAPAAPPAAAPADASASAGAAGSAPAPAPAQAAFPPSGAAQPKEESQVDERGAASSAQSPEARELARAEQQIASGDCPTACRALGSIERAVVVLCGSEGDPDRCVDAKGRLRASRKKVRDACGSCADGPSVDPNAPVPSSR